MDSYFGYFLQTMGATAACCMLGFTWYSDSFLGKIWWSHTFPGIAYGNCAAIKKTNALVLPPFSTSVMGTICQNTILTFTINTLLPVLIAADHHSCVGLRFPFTFAAITASICAFVTYPHYAYPRRPTVTYLIGTGFDTVQLFAAVFIIYFLSPGR